MTLYETVKMARFTAMKNKDATAKGTLSLVQSRLDALVKEKEVEARKIAMNAIVGSGIEPSETLKLNTHLSDEEVMAAIKSEIKQINDTIEAAKSAGREDIVSQEIVKIELLEKFLPRQLNESEILDLLVEKGAQKGMNMGQLMGMVMSTHKEVVDGKTVNKVIRENFM